MPLDCIVSVFLVCATPYPSLSAVVTVQAVDLVVVGVEGQLLHSMPPPLSPHVGGPVLRQGTMGRETWEGSPIVPLFWSRVHSIRPLVVQVA